MQLASGFMQLAAAGHMGATNYIFAVLLKEKCEWCIRMAITIFKTFISGVYVRKSRFTGPLTRRRKTRFPTYIRRYKSPMKILNTVISELVVWYSF